VCCVVGVVGVWVCCVFGSCALGVGRCALGLGVGGVASDVVALCVVGVYVYCVVGVLCCGCVGVLSCW